jgi:predicted O-methyltransferase YrrM
MKFAEVWREIGAVPYTNEHRCQLLYDLMTVNRIEQALELGTAYGKTACVMAAALDEGGAGQVFTVDLAGQTWQNPSVEQNAARLGLGDYLTVCREPVSYNWWLIQQIKKCSPAGHCEPCFDLIFLDGAHNVYTDTGAFFMAEKLLRPGGFLLFDDLHWTHRHALSGPVVWGQDTEQWSDAERDVPHVKLIWEFLAQQHPNLEGFLNLDNWWALCRKRRA